MAAVNVFHFDPVAARENERIRWGAACYEPVPYQTVVLRNVENLVMNNTTFSLPE